MKLHILGSSSSGNGYLLRSEKTGEVLAIEAGLRLSSVKKALNFNIGCISGLLVSHRHGDHAGHIGEFVRANIPTYTIADVIKSKCLSAFSIIHEVRPYRMFSVGSFSVIPFELVHDVPCVGYLINHEECGTVLFATDTCYIKNKFSGLNNILIECNYSLDLLNKNTDAGIISPVRRKRTIKSHMSLETCVETLQANDLSKVNNVVLIHLSNDNSNENWFVEQAQRATGKQVTAARKGLIIEFNKTPY